MSQNGEDMSLSSFWWILEQPGMSVGLKTSQHVPQGTRQVVLQAAAQGGGVYTRFREIILTFLRTDKHFSSDGHGGPQPMDVGAIR